MSDIFHTATILTERLRMEPFAIGHAPALNAINNEPQVMEFLTFGKPETPDETLTKIHLVRERWETLNFGWWALIRRDTEDIIGAACLQHVANDPDAPLEIGWRLTETATGSGYATEAGKAAATYGFETIGLDQIIAVAHQKNIASHRVMERIGMRFRGVETHYNEPCKTYVLEKSDL
ncbi:guanosine monophosphate synthetase [Loktanella sp. 5RATIMAR09]|uniref:GNAT family N-acetyltransferase n=1 Tax=Loktanella sp. 5RATIMAR09 TaxID=1225655 RepID=UPI0006EB302D|nr:GNAT family N-acetyltransferase [Loktanella sp. 5RATIMAR09]KQI72232.1 guanosine monophosphate synthetase [Loktanella sp. 5RATIMAR09]